MTARAFAPLRLALLAAILVAPSSMRAQRLGETIAFTGVEVHDGLGNVLDHATLAISGGKIVAIREGGALHGERGVSLGGRVVIPGIIDAGSSLLAGQGFAYEREDPVQPNLRVEDGIEALAGFHAGPVAIATGLVAAYLGPGSWRPIGGQGVTVRLDGETVLDMKLDGRSFVHFSINEGTLFTPGRGSAMPQTHMGIMAILRAKLTEARGYAEARTSRTPPPYDPDLEVLADVLSAKRTARIDVDTAHEIRLAIQLAEEFGFRPVLEHCTEAYRVRELLAEKRFPLVLLPFTEGSIHDLDVERAMLETPAWLAAHGVPIAFQTAGHGMPPYGNLHEYNEPRNLLLAGILQVRSGMDPEEVLRAMTSVPAELLGIGDRMGALRAGMPATFVVLDGQPFEYATQVEQIWIDGHRVFDAAHDPIVRR